jgi:hypothetical protein
MKTTYAEKIEAAMTELTKWVAEQPFADNCLKRSDNAREDLCQLRQFVADQSQAAIQSLPDSAVKAVEQALLTTPALVTEQGNGLPGIGAIVYNQETNAVYEVVAWDGSQHGSILTGPPGCGNAVRVLLSEIGDASDLTEDEWQQIEADNYRVNVGA